MKKADSTILSDSIRWPVCILQFTILIIALIGVLNTVTRFKALRSGEAIDPYRATELEARYAALRPVLQGVSMAGWMASRSVGASEADEVAYSIARYSLVPMLLCNHSKHHFVVADFDSESELEALLKGNEYQLVYRAATGPVVLERTSP